MSGCAVALALVVTGWLHERSDDGGRRLAGAHDFVRRSDTGEPIIAGAPGQLTPKLGQLAGSSRYDLTLLTTRSLSRLRSSLWNFCVFNVPSGFRGTISMRS